MCDSETSKTKLRSINTYGARTQFSYGPVINFLSADTYCVKSSLTLLLDSKI